MKHRNDANQDGVRTDNRFSDEMRGYVDLGMHAEALALARRFLQRDPLEVGAFNAAIDGLQVAEDRLKRWTRLVESAYARLPKKAKRLAKSAMFNFYYTANDLEKAVAFIPKRLDLNSMTFEWRRAGILPAGWRGFQPRVGISWLQLSRN